MFFHILALYKDFASPHYSTELWFFTIKPPSSNPFLIRAYQKKTVFNFKFYWSMFFQNEAIVRVALLVVGSSSKYKHVYVLLIFQKNGKIHQEMEIF